MMSKFLITGVAGFIMTNYLYYEINKYSKDFFCLIDYLTYARNYNNIKIRKKDNYKFYKIDIRNKKLLIGIIIILIG